MPKRGENPTPPESTVARGRVGGSRATALFQTLRVWQSASWPKPRRDGLRTAEERCGGGRGRGWASRSQVHRSSGRRERGEGRGGEGSEGDEVCALGRGGEGARGLTEQRQSAAAPHQRPHGLRSAWYPSRRPSL